MHSGPEGVRSSSSRSARRFERVAGPGEWMYVCSIVGSCPSTFPRIHTYHYSLCARAQCTLVTYDIAAYSGTKLDDLSLKRLDSISVHHLKDSGHAHRKGRASPTLKYPDFGVIVEKQESYVTLCEDQF